MNWLRKIRRAWIAVFSQFTRHRKSTGGNNNSNNVDNNGLVKLRDDVELCGYEDVRIMWNILNKSTQRSCQTMSDCKGISNGNGNAFAPFFGRHNIDPVPPFTLEKLN